MKYETSEFGTPLFILDKLREAGITPSNTDEDVRAVLTEEEYEQLFDVDILFL